MLSNIYTMDIKQTIKTTIKETRENFIILPFFIEIKLIQIPPLNY